MSALNLFRFSGVPSAVLSNGLGRYIPQCQRITLKFCKSHGSSRGMREFIENDLVDFARNNPSVVIYVKPRRHRTPVIVSEYLNGGRRWLPVKSFTRASIMKWLKLAITDSGQREKSLLLQTHTEYPSVQGPWTPFSNRDPDLNLVQYPSQELGSAFKEEKTATEQLLELYKSQKLKHLSQS